MEYFGTGDAYTRTMLSHSQERAHMSDAPVEEFNVASGFFVLNETSLRGDPPRHDRDMLELYKAADALRKRAFYTLVKHCVSTPFGYFVHDAGRKALEEEIAEYHEEAEAYNHLPGVDFRCYVNMIFIKPDGRDPVLRKRVAEFIVERLDAMRERLLTMDPKQDKKALIYTQDQTKRLDICLEGTYAKIVRRAIDEGLSHAHEVKKDPSLQQSLTFPALEAAKNVLLTVAELIE
jgi:hypothetical protein